MWYVGVDLSKKKWLAIGLRGRRTPKVNLFKTIEEFWAYYSNKAELILIDIPIGLPDRRDKERHCDREAKEQLKTRANSVFFTPCRSLVESKSNKSHKEASRINKIETGKGLSIQAYSLIPHIKQVDQFLQNNDLAQSLIKETHPEVCFSALNQGSPMKFSKKAKCENGLKERQQLLRKLYPYTQDVIQNVRQKYPLKKDVGDDDILDALVAAVTAYKSKGRLKSLPENPPNDAKGLPMQIVYYPIKK